jgi:uncharacterized protein YuzE
MEKIMVTYDTVGNTLDVWFGDPQSEAYCTEAENEVVLKKNNAGTVIGFEKLNYLPLEKRNAKLPVELVVM